MKKSILLLLVHLLAVAAIANIRLPSLVSSNMVLQQRTSVKVWGWASPAEKVMVYTSWNNKTDSTVTTRNAKFELTIQTPVAGGPFTIRLKGNNEIVLDNILVGEVWLCSGQSNMEFSYYNGIKEIGKELPSCYNSAIRFFNIPKTTSVYPQDNCDGKWTICDSTNLKSFSAVGYYFGKELHTRLNIPIGLINSSWGGTPAETWAPAEVVSSDTALHAAAKKLVPANWWPHTPGYTFNAMVAPLANYSIAGVIWYQGESNVSTAGTYQKLFSGMIDAWRKVWSKDFPFYYVQIAPYAYAKKNEGALLQEAQTKSMSHKNTGMVVITDLVDNVKDIHPQNKHDVGYRLATWALAKTYNKNGLHYRSPLYKQMSVEGDKAALSFDHAASGLVIRNGKVRELYVAGNDKNFHVAEATVLNNKLVVWSSQVAKPVAVRYGFSNTAIGNVFSTEGLPVTPFRTDRWEE